MLGNGVQEESLGAHGGAQERDSEHPEYSLEGLMLKLELQYFGQLMQRADLFEKTLMQGKIEGRRKRGRQRMIVGGRRETLVSLAFCRGP